MQMWQDVKIDKMQTKQNAKNTKNKQSKTMYNVQGTMYNNLYTY